MPSVRATFVEKPWGHEEIFASTGDYVGKILVIRGGEALSLQFHRIKDETIRVLEGKLDLLAGDHTDRLVTHRMTPGDVYHVTPGTIHRMTAVTDCRILEVSTPHLDDVVRLEDRYGREGTTRP